MSKGGLSESLLSRLSEFVADKIGLHFPQERWRDLERGIRAAAPAFGTGDVEACAALLLSTPLSKERIEILASELTVGETYFFREQRSFDVLREQILPGLITARQGKEQRLRVWSAGCCTGEEAYSIAIMLDRLLPFPSRWHVTIMATDINPRFLHKAKEGIFGEWSFRNPPTWLKETYFNEVGTHRYQILPRIREMVTFAYLNLAEDAYPSLLNNTNAMDLIFCRNVLMYFSVERAQKVIGNFRRSLVDGGRLVVSPTETSIQLFSTFTPLRFEGVVIYGKERENTAAKPVSVEKENLFDRLPLETPLPSLPITPSAETLFLPKEEVPAVEDKPSFYEEALALFEQGDYLEADRKLGMDAESGGRAENAFLQARICANMGRLAEALEWAEKAIAADKLNAGLHYLRAIILQEQSSEAESVVSLKRALYLDPDLVIAHFALGNLASRQNKLHEAVKHFANALALLNHYDADDVLPQSDGLAAGRLKEMIQSAMPTETIV